MIFREAIATAGNGQPPLLAFNVVDASSLFGIAQAAAAAARPVIAQVSPRTFAFLGGPALRGLVDQAVARWSVSCFLHLDHCDDETVLAQALDAGFDGIMVDASHHPFADNVDMTRRWAERARRAGAVVEGQLGAIGGSEDGFGGGKAVSDLPVEQYRMFETEAGVDLLGVNVGTAHGVYHEPPQIRFDLLRQLRSSLSSGLVVHGGSGLCAETLAQMAAVGVAKINISTDLKRAWLAGIRECLEGGQSEPIALQRGAQEAVARIAATKFAALERGTA